MKERFAVDYNKVERQIKLTGRSVKKVLSSLPVSSGEDLERIITNTIPRFKKILTNYFGHMFSLLPELIHEPAVENVFSSSTDGFLSNLPSKSVSFEDCIQRIVDHFLLSSEYLMRGVLERTQNFRAQSLAKFKKKKWICATRTMYTRDRHKELDGTIVSIDKPFTLVGANGVTYYPMYPHDNSLPLEEIYGCRCQVAYLD